MANISITFTGPVGQSYSATIQRCVDSYYRSANDESFISNPTFPAKAFALPEGLGENGGNYSQVLTGDTWQDGLYILRIHNTSACVGALLFAVKSGAEVPIGYEGQALDVYHADIQFTKNAAMFTDEYTVTWFRNGVRQNSGITNATIEVIKRSDGSDLISVSAMTQVGVTGSYKYDAIQSQRQNSGDTYIVIASAVINGAVRTFSWNLGRDT